MDVAFGEPPQLQHRSDALFCKPRMVVGSLPAARLHNSTPAWLLCSQAPAGVGHHNSAAPPPAILHLPHLYCLLSCCTSRWKVLQMVTMFQRSSLLTSGRASICFCATATSASSGHSGNLCSRSRHRWAKTCGKRQALCHPRRSHGAALRCLCHARIKHKERLNARAHACIRGKGTKVSKPLAHHQLNLLILRSTCGVQAQQKPLQNCQQHLPCKHVSQHTQDVVDG